MNWISYAFFRCVALIFALLPFRVIYVFSDFLAFVLHRVLKYRLSTVRTNLKNCFPEKSSSELKQIEQGSYKNLADITVEAIKGLTAKPEKIATRYTLKNPEVIDDYLKSGQSILVAGAHMANWEWCTLSFPVNLMGRQVAMYKPIKNKLLDNFMVNSRSKAGFEMISTKAGRTFWEDADKEPFLMVLGGDQHPSNRTKAYWINFFNRETAFLHGIENYAKAYDLPVVYVNPVRVARGQYDCDIWVLIENPKDKEPGEITKAYASKLESMIRKNPEQWVWSHKRWKSERPEGVSFYE